MEILRETGCTDIRFGIETGSPELLRRMNKQLDLERVRANCRLLEAAGMPYSFYLISSYPGETVDDVQRTIEFVRELNPTLVRVGSYRPFPGSADWIRLPKEERNRLAQRFDDFFIVGRDGKGGFPDPHAEILQGAFEGRNTFETMETPAPQNPRASRTPVETVAVS